MAKKEPELFVVIDGTKSEEEVWGEVRAKLEEWIK
jgi:thymidylate kinase